MAASLFPPSPDADLQPVTSLGTTAAAGLEPAAAALGLSGPAERRLDAAPLGAVLPAAGLVTRPRF